MSFLRTLFTAKDEPVRSYQDFWNWFRKHEKSFHKVVRQQGNVVQDFLEKLAPKLNELKDGYWYLTGMADEETVELVITADGTIRNIVFVEELIDAAPRIGGWKFTALKPALDIKEVCIEMDGYRFDSETLHFYANEHPDYPDEIDITVVHDKLTEDNRSVITNGIYIFLDNYLGEINFATAIDNLQVASGAARAALIPIERLKAYLKWRQTEYIEKYDGIRRGTENDGHSVLTATLESGDELIAVINTDLLQWDSKASHPWIVQIEVRYDGKPGQETPGEDTFSALDKLEEAITSQLKDAEGYLYIGRQTARGGREIYFACNDFRKPSKVIFEVQKRYAGRFDLSYDIYKDKYWRSFERFNPAAGQD